MSKQVWNFKKDELLIKIVRSKPDLYNLESPRYKHINYKKKIWREVEEIIKLNGAKMRWESLRSQYRKYLAKLRTKSTQPDRKVLKWRYSEQMEFLNDYIKVDGSRISSIAEKELDCDYFGSEIVLNATSLDQSNDYEEIVSANDSSDSFHQSPSVSATKNITKIQIEKIESTDENMDSESSVLMKYLLENNKSERSADSIDQFFLLMANTVKKFSPLDQHKVKTKIFSLINVIEEKYLEPISVLGQPSSIQNIQIPSSASSHSSSTSHYMTRN